VHARQKYECFGDVRGSGLMVGVEVVASKAGKQPAPHAAGYIKEAMVARRVLLAVDGPHANVIKIKPPMVFAEPEVNHLIAVLDQVSGVTVRTRSSHAGALSQLLACLEKRLACSRLWGSLTLLGLRLC
jgi:acetylornithine/succinyldiaminopimelate/putrescine aminotransferase